jgi:hypothetical protein
MPDCRRFDALPPLLRLECAQCAREPARGFGLVEPDRPQHVRNIGYRDPADRLSADNRTRIRLEARFPLRGDFPAVPPCGLVVLDIGCRQFIVSCTLEGGAFSASGSRPSCSINRY